MKTKLSRCFFVLTILSLFFAPVSVLAGPVSPFVGHWLATDVDGSDIRLTIAGPPNGPFNITWTESYITFCDGGAGIVRGTGWPREDDPNFLEADLHLVCFPSEESLDFHAVWRYVSLTDTLSQVEPSWIIFYRSKQRVDLHAPRLDLRVNYGHDWVESFYEAGHTVWITVTESDGVTVKATAELVTEPRDFWDSETGFQTTPEDWNPSPPDIQPYDWVFGWVDNGASAQVQLGEISGEIDLEGDSIQGTILAPWFSSEVFVECHPWGSPEPVEMEFDMVFPDGEDPYSCSWAGGWDIQPEQDVGIGYYGPDGHWVANAFRTDPFIWVDPVSEYVNGWNWPVGKNVMVNAYDPSGNLVYSAEQVAGSDTGVGFDVGDAGVDLQAGFSVILSDDLITKELVVSALQLTNINQSLRTISGIYDPNPDLRFWINLSGREPESLVFDGENWSATFVEFIPGEWGEVAQPDNDGDMTGFSFMIPF